MKNEPGHIVENFNRKTISRAKLKRKLMDTAALQLRDGCSVHEDFETDTRFRADAHASSEMFFLLT